MIRKEIFPIAGKAAASAKIQPGWQRDMPWLLLLLVASVGSSFTFACVTPFAAFAVLAAATLPRWTAFGAMAAIWGINQIMGYGVLGYPWDASSLSWGLMLAVASLAATLGASWSFSRLSGRAIWARLPIASMAAFAIYEGVLLVASLFLGDTQNFMPEIVAKLALSDAGWLLGLSILRHFLVSLRLVSRRTGGFGKPVLP